MLGCAGAPKAHNLPPAQQLLEPGPGVGGPGPGVIAPSPPPQQLLMAVPLPSVQVNFARPDGMQVRWDVTGQGMFDSEPLIVPGKQNFPQNAIYRLKLTNIPGKEGAELYPTIEIGPTTPRTEAFLAHNTIPMQLTEEDFDQVMAGNFVTKVIYLPDPEFQELALAGVETLVSTRLDPGVDPIVEADRRGSIMAVIRLGNKDVELGGQGEGSAVYPAGFAGAMEGGLPCGPNCGGPGCGCGRKGGGIGSSDAQFPASLPPPYVAGVTAPQYGMTTSGTPIGLPGPPHIPFGAPAGLQKHVMKNHTHMHLPSPVESMKIHVKQQPGMSYPRPANRAYIREQSIHPSLPYGQPHYDKHQNVGGPVSHRAGGLQTGGIWGRHQGGSGACADGSCE
jgi:hypothetical protein